MASKTVIGKIQLRRDTAANWTVKNPILSSGELGYETDTRKCKVGDGSTTWNSLKYAWQSEFVSACTSGDYYAKNTVISLSVSLGKYKKLLFVCGTDSATEGVQTIEVPLNTGRTCHRLVWFTGDVSTNYQWDGIARNAKAITVTINTSTNKVTIVSSNVTANGIRQIYAE